MFRLFPRRPVLIRRLRRVRAPIPRFAAGAFRIFRVPIAVLTIGAGVYAYANYKIEQLRNRAVSTVKDAASSVSARVPTVKLSDIKTPQFVKDLLSSDAATGLMTSGSGGLKSVFASVSAVKPSDIKTPQPVKDLLSSDAATGLISSASSGLKSISARVFAVKPSNIETPQPPKDPFPSDDSTHHDHSFSSQDSGNPPNTSPEENAAVAAFVAVIPSAPSDSTEAEDSGLDTKV